ncbi:MAG TPA: SDR family oxidoreductase [Hyphomicrobiales bacterium]|nr:SDR family oxidoreductase [Hyphomicrobiales bacterium]
MANSYTVPSQEGRIAIVTGANSGIGLWTAARLAKAGAKVIMLCRNRAKGEAAQNLVRRSAPHAPDLMLADFSRLAEVRDAAAKILERYPRIHMLVNNAGLFSRHRELSADGYEMTFAVNHLAPFLFTNTLLPALERAGELQRHARIVTVASKAADRARIDFADLMGNRNYNMFKAYNQSKLANILFTKELARRLPPRPIGANCLHPGVVATRIGNKGGLANLVWTAIKPFLLSSERGAVNSLFVATSPEIEGVSGAYFVEQKTAAPNPIANDEETAARLWLESEKLVEAALQKACAVA